jgi:hypothetical protein
MEVSQIFLVIIYTTFFALLLFEKFSKIEGQMDDIRRIQAKLLEDFERLKAAHEALPCAKTGDEKRGISVNVVEMSSGIGGLSKILEGIFGGMNSKEDDSVMAFLDVLSKNEKNTDALRKSAQKIEKREFKRLISFLEQQEQYYALSIIKKEFESRG